MPKPIFIDTHCHIHDDEFFGHENITLEQMIADAEAVGVNQMICVGTDVKSSESAVQAAEKYSQLYSSVALHPHEASNASVEELTEEVHKLHSLVADTPVRLVAIGECGLDYFYHQDDSVKEKQKHLLREHLVLAQRNNLPVIFHVREAFDDFFAIYDEFSDIRGVLHSFTDSVVNMKEAVKRGLYIGLNGIMTFTREESQLEMARQVPLEYLVLETDAPFLTPKPFRGRICKPEHVVTTAEFLSGLRQEKLEELARATTINAKQLFTIK